MRSLRHFSAQDWLRLLPLQHAAKQWRNDIWQALYERRRPAGLDAFLAQTRPLAGKNIVLVIAFEQPWALDWLLRMAARFINDATVLVFDNSRRADARAAIERVCRERCVPYLGLPPNTTRHVNRSHGMAMSWVYRNVVRVIEPAVFGFIDHDLIPIQPFGLAQRMGAQACYGMLLQRQWAWQLWAGYCFFDYRQVCRLPLNFLYDFSNGLDTGGRNWRALYRRQERSELRLAGSEVIEVTDPLTHEPRRTQIVDRAWLHIGGISYNDNFKSKAEFCDRLAQCFEQGLDWQQICGAAAKPASAVDTASASSQR